MRQQYQWSSDVGLAVHTQLVAAGNPDKFSGNSNSEMSWL
jgi:hypothetical protein